MPRLVHKKKGKRINIWIPAVQVPILNEIENHSRFFQMALDQCVGIMTWAILKERQPEMYHETHTVDTAPNVVAKFNDKYPLPNSYYRLTKNARAERENTGDSPQPNTELW